MREMAREERRSTLSTNNLKESLSPDQQSSKSKIYLYQQLEQRFLHTIDEYEVQRTEKAIEERKKKMGAQVLSVEELQ